MTFQYGPPADLFYVWTPMGGDREVLAEDLECPDCGVLGIDMKLVTLSEGGQYLQCPCGQQFYDEAGRWTLPDA